MSFAHTDRTIRGIKLTNIDEAIWEHDLDLTEFASYEYAVSDRNDSALMAALTIASNIGCRALKNRLLAGL